MGTPLLHIVVFIATLFKYYYHVEGSILKNAHRGKYYSGVINYIQYAVDRLGLLPLPNIEPLKPEFGLVVNNVTSFRYPITIPSCREVNARRNIFIAVISATDNFEKRAVIRQTWATDLNLWDRSLTGFAGYAFILGRTEDLSIQKRIEEENKTYKDIIQIDTEDVYRNLPMKMAGLLNWMRIFCANFKGFLLKVDDDVYVRVRTLEYVIHDNDPSSLGMFGHSNYGAAQRDPKNKHAITFDEWPWIDYPMYLEGGAYLMSSEAIVPLLAAIQTTPMIPFEDVYITGICAEKANIRWRSKNEISSTRVLCKGMLKGHGVRQYATSVLDDPSDMTKAHWQTNNFYDPLKWEGERIFWFTYANGKQMKVYYDADPLVPPL